MMQSTDPPVNRIPGPYDHFPPGTPPAVLTFLRLATAENRLRIAIRPDGSLDSRLLRMVQVDLVRVGHEIEALASEVAA